MPQSTWQEPSQWLERSDVEGFEEINKRMCGVFAYLEKAAN